MLNVYRFGTVDRTGVLLVGRRRARCVCEAYRDEQLADADVVLPPDAGDQPPLPPDLRPETSDE